MQQLFLFSTLFNNLFSQFINILQLYQYYYRFQFSKYQVNIIFISFQITTSKTHDTRLARDIKDFYQLSQNLNITGGPINGNLSEQEYVIHVPEDDKTNPYYGGYFKFHLQIPQDYPFKPPKVTVLTNIFHPNFKGQDICLDILRQQEWSPALNIVKVLLSIESLLTDPNPHSPLNSEAAELCLKDKQKYNQKIHEFVLKYAQKQ